MEEVHREDGYKDRSGWRDAGSDGAGGCWSLLYIWSLLYCYSTLFKHAVLIWAKINVLIIYQVLPRKEKKQRERERGKGNITRLRMCVRRDIVESKPVGGCFQRCGPGHTTAGPRSTSPDPALGLVDREGGTNDYLQTLAPGPLGKGWYLYFFFFLSFFFDVFTINMVIVL